MEPNRIKVYIASDHAGLTPKDEMKPFIEELGYEVIDCGPTVLNTSDDYPDYVQIVARAVSEKNDSKKIRGIVIGGSGQGEAMSANRFPNVRCTLFYGPEPLMTASEVSDGLDIIRVSRDHNDANMLSLGARFLTETVAKEAVRIWLGVPFSGDPRHVRRINKIEQWQK